MSTILETTDAPLGLDSPAPENVWVWWLPTDGPWGIVRDGEGFAYATLSEAEIRSWFNTRYPEFRKGEAREYDHDTLASLIAEKAAACGPAGYVIVDAKGNEISRRYCR